MQDLSDRQITVMDGVPKAIGTGIDQMKVISNQMPSPSSIAAKLLLFIILSIPLAHSPYAQETITDLVIYNSDNGLPRSSINDVTVDRAGYMWLATERGILRFDGRNFLDVPTGLPEFENRGTARLLREDDLIHIVYEDSGCLAMDPGRTRFRVLTRSPVADVVSLPGGNRVVLERNGVLVKYGRKGATASSRHYVEKPGLLAWHEGRLLASLPGNGMYVVDTSDLSLGRRLDALPNGYFEHFIPTPGGLRFITTTYVLNIRSDLSIDTTESSFGLERDKISFLNDVSEGHRFLIRDNRYLEEVRSGRSRRIDLPSLTNYELRKLLAVDSSNVLLCTNQGLIHVNLRPKAIDRIDDNTERGSEPIRIRRKILEGEKGTLYLTGHPYSYMWDGDGGLTRMTSEKLSVYDAVQVAGRFYLATEGRGILSIDPRSGRLRNHDIPPLETLGQYIALAYDNGRMLYIGSDDRIFRLDLGNDNPTIILLPRKTGRVRDIRLDTATGEFWIGTQTGLLCLDSLFRLKADLSKANGGLTGQIVHSILPRTGKGECWVSHEGGVDIVDMRTKLRLRSLPTAIFSDTRVVSMLEDRKGRVWMGTYSGIVGYDPETGSFYRLGRNNDLMNLEFNHKSALALSDGRLVFGGLNGYDIIDPERIGFKSRTDRGVITGLHRFVVSDTVFQNVESGQTVSFDTEKESLRVYISSSGMMDAFRHTYEYRIGEGRWIGIQGPSHIDVFRLDPGTYSLQVRGFDEYGNMVEFAPLSIEATLPFVKSRLFLALLSLTTLVVLTLFIATLLRTRRQERELKERISMDLHDEVGTTLTRALYVARLKEGAKDDNRLIAYLNESLFSLRAYINTMNTADFTFRQLTDEIRELSHSLVNMTGFEALVTDRSDGEYQVKGELYRDVKLCLYEIVNNALKYSQGTCIRVEVSADDGWMTLSVRDDGVLESPDSLGRKGNGMKNIRKRVAKHHGTVAFEVPGPGTGLMVRMRFPLKRN